MSATAVAGVECAPEILWLGRCGYEPTWRAMQRYTQERGPDAPDQIWLLDHEVTQLKPDGSTSGVITQIVRAVNQRGREFIALRLMT